MPVNGTPAPRPGRRGFVLLAGAFFGVCAGCSALVTATEAWQDHVRAHWPAATAQIKTCKVNFAYAEEKYLNIACLIRNNIATETLDATVMSRKARAPDAAIFRWPPHQIGETEMQSWVDAHPAGTSIPVHYDPAQHATAVLIDVGMPLGDARTPGNLRATGLFAAISAAILALGLILRRH